MMEPIDFTNKAMAATDWKNTYQADDGTFFRKYECSYQFQDKKWGIQIWARNHEEAEARLKSISFGSVDGLIIEEIPA